MNSLKLNQCSRICEAPAKRKPRTRINERMESRRSGTLATVVAGPLYFFRRDVAPSLTKHYSGHFALRVYNERDLRVNRLKEEYGFRFGKKFEFRLRGNLREQLALFERDVQHQLRRELILTNVFFEGLRCDVDFLAFGRNFIRGAENDCRQVIGDLSRGRPFHVAQDDNSYAVGGVARDV